MSDRTDEQIIEQIKGLLDAKVAPAVARHGGKINFVNYEEGALMLELSGACAGCAGSKMTLKMGVERLLKAEIPELEVVEAVDDENSGVDPYYQAGTVNVLNYKDV
jgi:Fe-S cluster biogenesis protein NfuA